MHMKFSVGTGRVSDIRHVARIARTADECGYSRISFPDTPAVNRDVHVMMTVAALNTHRIHVGHGVTDPSTFHPSVIANATATIDELSGGRAYVGLGAGGPYGKSMKPVTMRELRDAIRYIKDYTSGKEVEWKGGRIRSEWVTRPLPVHMAVEGPRACRLAGELADGVIFLGVHPDHVGWRLELIEQGARKAGRRLCDIDIGVRAVVYPSTSAEEALGRTSPHVAASNTCKERFATRPPSSRSCVDAWTRTTRAGRHPDQGLRHLRRQAAKRRRARLGRGGQSTKPGILQPGRHPGRDHPSHRGAGQAWRIQHFHHALYPDGQERAAEVDSGDHHAELPPHVIHAVREATGRRMLRGPVRQHLVKRAFPKQPIHTFEAFFVNSPLGAGLRRRPFSRFVAARCSVAARLGARRRRRVECRCPPLLDASGSTLRRTSSSNEG